MTLFMFQKALPFTGYFPMVTLVVIEHQTSLDRILSGVTEECF
jgi:hypothetical protein